MISKNTIKLIKSLALKKYRIKENLFLVEGDKNVSEVLKSNYKVEKLFATDTFSENYSDLIKNANFYSEVDKKEISKASLLKNPQNSIAICSLRQDSTELKIKLCDSLSVYLDDIQDPGNLGTIIRICDWFGIDTLYCSPNTADMYNPKIIQASMGSFCRVKVIYTSFEKITNIAHENDVPIYGAFIDGQNIYNEKLPAQALLIMGNEGNGISKELEAKIDKRIKIPAYTQSSESAESLNVSVATAIICSEFKRQISS